MIQYSLFYFTKRGALNDLSFLICIKMFILKLQARNPEKILQANIQSPTRIKISRNQMALGCSLTDSLTETKLRYISID